MLKIDFSDTMKEWMIYLSVMFAIGVSGLIFGLTYFIMDNVYTSFLAIDCNIPSNTLVSTCQELFELALFPILRLKTLLIFLNYFAIFGWVFGLFFMGFRTKKHPVLLIVHIVTSIVIGYISIEVGNIYRTMISNTVIYNMLQPFGVYNRIMLYFPHFMFFVIFLSGIIGFMGVFKGINQFNEGAGDLG